MIYLKLFLTFMKIGAFTFGGGYAMLPLIEKEVISHGWLDAKALVDFIAVSESTPGPFAINISTYVGARVGGILGSLCTTLGVVLPSFVIILLIARCYETYKNNKFVKGCMNGLKPAVVGLIGASVISVAKTVFMPDGFSASMLTDAAFGISVFIFLTALVLLIKKAHPILIICVSAMLGIIIGFLGI